MNENKKKRSRWVNSVPTKWVYWPEFSLEKYKSTEFKVAHCLCSFALSNINWPTHLLRCEIARIVLRTFLSIDASFGPICVQSIARRPFFFFWYFHENFISTPAHAHTRPNHYAFRPYSAMAVTVTAFSDIFRSILCATTCIPGQATSCIFYFNNNNRNNDDMMNSLAINNRINSRRQCLVRVGAHTDC